MRITGAFSLKTCASNMWRTRRPRQKRIVWREPWKRASLFSNVYLEREMSHVTAIYTSFLWYSEGYNENHSISGWMPCVIFNVFGDTTRTRIFPLFPLQWQTIRDGTISSANIWGLQWRLQAGQDYGPKPCMYAVELRERSGLGKAPAGSVTGVRSSRE